MITELPGRTQKPEPKYPNRIAVIEVTYDVFSHLGIPVDAADTQGYLRDTGVFNRIKEALLLPPSYTVLNLFTGPLRRTWLIGVESPDLPVVTEYEEAPRITPTYIRKDDGTVELKGIEYYGKY